MLKENKISKEKLQMKIFKDINLLTSMKKVKMMIMFNSNNMVQVAN